MKGKNLHKILKRFYCLISCQKCQHIDAPAAVSKKITSYGPKNMSNRSEVQGSEVQGSEVQGSEVSAFAGLWRDRQGSEVYPPLAAP